MKKLVNFRPALFFALAFIFGILFAFSVVKRDVFLAVTAGILAAGVFILFILFPSANFSVKLKCALSICFVLFIFLGGLRFYFAVNAYENAGLNDRYLSVSGKVDEVKTFDGKEYAVISGVNFNGSVSGRTDYRISLYIDGYKGLRIGDTVSFSAVVNDKGLFYDGKFAAYAVADKVKYYAYVSDVEINGSAPSLFQRINLSMYDTLQAGLTGDDFAVAYALLTGNSDYMTEDTVSSFRNAGAAHIFAVSGLHVGFLAAAVAFILKKCRVNGYAAYAITLICCFAYSGICSFTASSLRAVIMFAVLGFAPLTGKRYDGISSVALAAAVILIISPAQLMCAGFQLSFTVAFFLTVLARPLTVGIKKICKFLPEKACGVISACLTAQLAAIPVSLHFFGSFSAVGVIVNILFIPVVGALFILLFICVVLGAFISPVVVLFLPKYAIIAVRFLISFFDGNIFTVGGFIFGAFAITYYFAFIVCGGLINLKRAAKIALSFALIFITAAGVAIKTVDYNAKCKITVLGTENFCACIVSERGENLLVVSRAEYVFSYARLKKVADGNNIKEVAVLLLEKEGSYDLQVLVSKLSGAVKVSALYISGDTEEEQKTVLKRAFPDVALISYASGTVISVGNSAGIVENEGKCFLISGKGGVTAIYAKLNDSPFSVSVTPDTVVCYDKADYIFSAYAPERLLTYLKSGSFENAESGGVVTILK